jgi:predicted  nucleic acid-binding Zn-ribbon protein
VDPARPQPRRTGLNASPADQSRLLDLQAFDTRIDQIAHRRAGLPEHAEIAALEARIGELRDEVVVAETEHTDVSRELVKAEGDVELVRQRSARDQGRLDSGQGSHKDLESIQHEMTTLAKRQSDLEDIELEVMERLEGIDARVRSLKAERDGVVEQLEITRAHRDVVVGELDAETAQARRERDALAADLPTDLVTLYEKIRASSGGTGAAVLHQRRCEGCRLELTPTDMQRIRAAAEDEVLRCEECRRILVRVPESGL